MVKRKNHHLVEIARTLLLHHTVPQRFWGDVILTAYYLINRMPSSVLGDQVLHSLLFPNQPFFCLPPRVFNALVLSTYLLLAKINFLLRPRSASSLVIPAFNAGTISILPIHIDTSFPLMSPFLNILLFSLPHPRSSPEVLSLPLIFPIPSLSSESPTTPPRPLQVYTRRPHTDTEPLDDLSPMVPSSTMSVLPPPVDPPIAIQKGTRFSRNTHPIYTFMSYHRLSLPYSAFISTLSSVSLPNTVHEALSHPGLKQAMVEEMIALHSTGTWDPVPLLASKSPVGCCWVYTVKIRPNGRVDCLKARLVVKGYTQIYDSDYYDTFSLVAKMTSVHLLLSMATMSSWPLY